MSSTNDYLRNAEACERLAEESLLPEDRATFRALAADWRAMAEQETGPRRARGPIPAARSPLFSEEATAPRRSARR